MLDANSEPTDGLPARPARVTRRRLIVVGAVVLALALVSGGAAAWWVTSDSCGGKDCRTLDAAASAGPGAGDGAATDPGASADPSASASASASTSASAAPSASRTAGPATVAGGFPNAGNTGVPSGKQLRPSGGIRVQKAGTVIDGMEFSGDISVEADNVTIQNVRVHTAGHWGIIQRQGVSGLVVKDSEIKGNGREQLKFAVINQGGMITIQRNEFSVVSDHISTSVGLIVDNYIHSPKFYPGDHIDGIQSNSGPGNGQTLIIRHNTIIIDYDQTAAIALFQDFGLQHSALIENNLLAGGGYTVYGGAGKYGKSHNIRVVNNVFSRQVYPKGGNFGPVAYWDGDGNGNEWSGNVWQDTKEPVKP